MKQNELKKVGRKPKQDPAKNRYVFYLNEVDNAKFLSLFEQSKIQVKAHFITTCIFNKPIKVVTLNKELHDYYMRLTSLYGQFRAIGVNYNQVVKALKSNFTENKALSMLYKLEQQTIELVKLNHQIILLTEKFEQELNK